MICRKYHGRSLQAVMRNCRSYHEFISGLRSSPLLTRRVGFFLALWLAAVSLIWYSDTTRDYTTGFSEAAFRTITPEQSESKVRDLLGPPFREFWFYTPTDPRPPDERPVPTQQGCLIVRFDAGIVAMVHHIEACRARGVGIGLSPIDVKTSLGSPSESCWQYSWNRGGATYRERLVCFSNAKVQMVVRKWG
jgi:hypothetical protein